MAVAPITAALTFSLQWGFAAGLMNTHLLGFALFTWFFPQAVNDAGALLIQRPANRLQDLVSLSDRLSYLNQKINDLAHRVDKRLWDQLEIESSQGLALLNSQHFSRARAHFMRAEEIYIKWDTRASNDFTKIQAHIASSYFHEGDFSKALPYYESALETELSLTSGEASEMVVILRYHMAQCKLEVGDAPEAFALFNQALDSLVALEEALGALPEEGAQINYRDLKTFLTHITDIRSL